jgi:hypothetical protein
VAATDSIAAATMLQGWKGTASVVTLVAVIVTAWAVFRDPPLLTAGLVAAGIPVGMVLIGRSGRLPVVVVGAAALLLAGELAGWSFDERGGLDTSRLLVVRRGLECVAVACGGLVAGLVVLALAGISAPSGAWALVVALAAASAVVALLATRRWRDPA